MRKTLFCLFLAILNKFPIVQASLIMAVFMAYTTTFAIVRPFKETHANLMMFGIEFLFTVVSAIMFTFAI
jgi:hypothetical protein